MSQDNCINELRVCIWCSKSESETPFNNRAHIFPDSLGGTRICRCVCDDCNTYFGSKQNGLPSVEIAFKEILNISKTILRLNMPLLSKQKFKFKSEYFKFDKKSNVIKPLFKYSTLRSFQNDFIKQFARGVYKVFLEERQESRGDSIKSDFNFIREFARYGVGQLPIFYCRPDIPAIAVSEDVTNPVIRFTDYSDYTMSNFGFYSYDFMTHTLVFPTINNYRICFDAFVQHLREKNFYSSINHITSVTDIDLFFTYALGDDNVRSRRWG